MIVGSSLAAISLARSGSSEGCAVTKLLHSRPKARSEEEPSHCYQNLVRLWLIKIVKTMDEGQEKD